MFSVRIVSTSHYQANPIVGLDTTHSDFRNCSIKRVPVLRIFGSTPAGQKTCLHLHGVFPYLYVPYDGTQPSDRYLRQFAVSLDKALNIANRSTNSNFQHVYKISLVSGIPMYGYHPQEECFLKIYLYNPNNVRKAADLLLGGAVMNKPFQPHESHIPYTLQLFMDYSLYGMNFINVAALKFRRQAQGETNAKPANKVHIPAADTSQLENASQSTYGTDIQDHIWNEATIPSELWLPVSIEKQSTCELEVDVVAADITNRQDIANNIGANPGLTVLWEDEKQRRRDGSEPSQLETDNSQERVGVVSSNSDQELVKRFLDIIRQQQNLVRSSQSDDGLLSQSSQSASQLEHHVSMTDSMQDSENTIILGNSDEESKDRDEEENIAIVNLKSIERVVQMSQSFSLGSAQKATPANQDQNVEDILAALLEESGPIPPSLVSLEDQDSVLNQSKILDKEEENDEEEETLLMSQAMKGQDDATKESGLDVDIADLLNRSYVSENDDDDDIIMNTDDENEDDDYLPQFDGTSDKVTGSQKKPDESQIPTTINPLVQEPVDTAQNEVTDTSTDNRSELSWRAGSAGMLMGTTHGFPGGSGSWSKQGWSPQSAPGSVYGHGQSSAWSQQQYQNWPQQMSPSAFPSQPAPYHSPSSSSSFQSPTHNPYTSPTHQAYQTPSPSGSHHQYQYPSYQSPTSTQTYQQPYHSSSQHSYQSSGSNQSFHSPHSYHSSSNQPFQSPSASQSYSSVGAPSQSYQSPTANKPYMSPPGNQPYQSPQCNSGYQQTGGTMYPTSYQSPPQSHHTSPQQPYPPPYQSMVQAGRYPPQSSWSPQGYPDYFQGLPCNAGNTQKHSSVSGQPSQSDTLSLRSPGNSTISGPSVGFQSQDSHLQQMSPGSQKQQLTDLNTTNKLLNPHIIAGQETYGSQSTDVVPTQKKRRGGRKGKESSKSGEFKSPHPPVCLSPTPSALNNPYDISPQSTHLSSLHSSNINTQLMVPGATTSQSPSQLQQTSSHFTNVDSNKMATVSDRTESASKISLLEFRPNNAPNLGSLGNTTATLPVKSVMAADTNKTPGTYAEKLDTATTSTPMIQQLLMEEPVRMNIRKEDRDAVMKKPMGNPTPPKPRKKYTRRTTQTGRKPGRPRSMSLSSSAPPGAGCYGYPQAMMNPVMADQQQKFHLASHSYSNEPRMQSVSQNYAWQQQQQQQWKQQNFIPGGGQWQQQQQQHHQQWGLNDWQGYNSQGECETGTNCVPATSRLHQRSLSADAVQPPIYDNPHTNQSYQFPANQANIENSSSIQQTITNIENPSDKSSLSSLFQLVSDVGSESIDWDNESSTVVPNIFPNSSESETCKSTPTPDLNQESPSVKDFITLETPNKQEMGKTDSDAADISYSEDSDHANNDPPDHKSNALGRSCSAGVSLAQVGKPSKMRKLGPLSTRIANSVFIVGPIEPNPAYTYTFHVPTPVFKKLKFYQNSESRKHNINVVRMHPMDARRYSLLKIGREIVKVIKLTEADLAQYSARLPPIYPFVSADGSTNRVNLDIPVVSVDRRSGDSGSEESSLSKFDADFPPNKVAPPSFFNASEVSASLTRATSTTTRASPGSSDWIRHHGGPHQVNFNGRFTSGSMRETYHSQSASFSQQQSSFPFVQQQRDGILNASPGHQQVLHNNFNKPISTQPSMDTPGLSYPHYSQKGSSLHQQSMPSYLSNEGNYYQHQQGQYIKHAPYSPHQPYCQQHYQQHEQFRLQHHQHPQHQPQTNYNGSNQEPKNGLRSPSQHGQTSRIENGRVHGHSECHMTDVSTTETSPINTRVNALCRENHAEVMANHVDTQFDSIMTNTPCSSSCEYTQSLTRVCSYNGSNHNLCKKSTKLNNVNRPNPCSKKSKSLSFKKSENCDINSDEQSVGNISGKNFLLEYSNVDNTSKLMSSAKLKPHDAEATFYMEIGRKKGKINGRKNVKALRLTIPHLHDHRQGGLLNHNDLTDDDPATCLHKDPQTSISNTESTKVSSHGRSKRSTSIEEDAKSFCGGRQSPRQAKLRSPYSKFMYNLKPKRKKRKRNEPQIEGIHYIVIGKFKGHQSMLVKVKRTSLAIGEDTVSASHYHDLAAKEIVRVVSLEDRLLDTDYRQNPTDVYSENHSDEEKRTHSECEYFNSEVASTPRIFQKPSRGRSLRHGRYRSSHASLTKQEVLKDSPIPSPFSNESHSKNMRAGPISEGVYHINTNRASDNVMCHSFVLNDDFFVRFKENFMKRTKTKELTINKIPSNNDCLFFKGVMDSNFQIFCQKFLANIERLKSNEYSSSSDEEDDIFDEIILKDKLVYGMEHLSSDNRSSSQSYSVRKNGQNSIDLLLNKSDRRNDGSQITPQLNILDISHDCGQSHIVKGKEISNIKESASEFASYADCSNDGDTKLSSDFDTQFDENNLNRDKQHREALSKHVMSKSSSICEKAHDQIYNAVEPKESVNILDHKSILRNTSNLINVKDNEDREDYLKSQMAFFEDISSDSNNDEATTISDSIGKDNMSESNQTVILSVSPISESSLNTLSPSTNTMDEQLEKTLLESKCLSQNIISKDKYPVNLSVIQDPVLFREDMAVHHMDLKSDTNELSFNLPSGDEQVFESHVLDTNKPEQIKSLPEITCKQITESVLNIAHQNLYESDETTIELDLTASVSSTYLKDDSIEQLNTTLKTDDPSKEKLINKSLGSDNDFGNCKPLHAAQRQKKHGKGLKKSKRDKGSQLANRRQLIDVDNSSSNDEANLISDSFVSSENKCLRQRKETLYNTDLMDSTEDDSSDSSDEDFLSRGSQRKRSKNNRKQKGLGFKDRQKSFQINIEAAKSTKSGNKSRPSRGKKKKTVGGDKLLNSLSLLHMATLANLTEVQSDAAGDLSSTVTNLHNQSEHNLHCSDIIRSEYNTSFPSSKQHTSFISPQNYREYTVRQQNTCSPTDKIKWKQTGGTSNRGDNFVVSRRSASLRPGCNGASNLGSKPLTFNRLMGNSTSSVPSNYSFGQILDNSMQNEPFRQHDDAGTSNTLQLLETRKAQVNCASFSMKDILRLTTPDDSMDSDSKDSAALIKPPEPKRAQVKSTTLSMSDILKLTSCADKVTDTGNLQTSQSVFSHLPNSDHYQTSFNHASLEALDYKSSLPSTHHIQNIAASTLLQETSPASLNSHSQEKSIEKFDKNTPYATNTNTSKSPVSIATSGNDHTLLSSIKDFIKEAPQTANKYTEYDGDNRLKSESETFYSTDKTSQPKLLDTAVIYDINNDTTQSKILDTVAINNTTSQFKILDTVAINNTTSQFKILDTVANNDTRSQSKILDTGTTNENCSIEMQAKPTKPAKGLTKDSQTSCSINNDKAIDKTDVRNFNLTKRFENIPHASSDTKGSGLGVNCSQSSTSTAINSPPYLKDNACLGPESKPELLSPYSQMSSCMILEIPVCKPTNKKTIPLDKEPPCQHSKQKTKREAKKQNNTERLTSKASLTTLQQDSEIKESLICSEEKAKICPKISNQKSPQLNVPRVPCSSVLQIPKISITCEETSSVEKFENICSKSPTGKTESENKTNENIKEAERDLKPLHPLQIPPYSFLGLGGYTSHPSQVFNNSINPPLYYPYCWQWPFHTPSIDPSVSPLNLCTIQKSNAYSPITPTSPISPNYQIQSPHVPSSDMSPPLKKAKPLWYPWLTVESARNRSEPMFGITNQHRDISRRDSKTDTENSYNLSASSPIFNSQNHTDQAVLSPARSESVCSQILTNKHDTKINSVSTNYSSRIADLLSSPPCTPNSVRIHDKLSNCQTVSQFLGSVIETAYEQGNDAVLSSSAIDISENNLNVSNPSFSNSISTNLTPTISVTTNSEHVSDQLNVYSKGKTARRMKDTSKKNCVQNELLSSLCSQQDLWNSGCGEDISSHSKEAGKTTLYKTEHKQQRKGRSKKKHQSGMLISVSSLSPNHVDSNYAGLAERLITKLIKGDSFEYNHHAVVEAPGSQKKSDSGDKKAGSELSRNENLKKDTNMKSNKETIPVRKRETCSEKDKNADKSLACVSDRGITLRPVKPPPKWSDIENSLLDLGLNSVQPPAAFCSNLDDVPSRSMEHGGRVLKVESKRLCELSAFINCQHILGLTFWRKQSLSSSKILASQGIPLWKRLEQEPQLQLLLGGEKRITVTPICMPPTYVSVKKWLQDKILNIKLAGESLLHQDKLNNQQSTDKTSADHKRINQNHNKPQMNPNNTASLNLCNMTNETKKLNLSISEIGLSQFSSSECDISAQSLDTDLDISCTPSKISSLTLSSTQSSSKKHSTPLSQELVLPSPHVSKSRRKRKLPFADESCQYVPEEISFTDSRALDKKLKKIHKRKNVTDDPVASSTPEKPFTEGLSDLTCIPVSSPQEHPQPSSSSAESRKSGNVQEAAECSQISFLRHVTTSTESTLKNSILTSLTQRQPYITKLNDVSQIEGPTPKNSFGFKVMQTHVQDSKALHKYQSVTVLSLELHIETRGDLRPDPEFDAIHAFFYSVLNDIPPEKGKRVETGVVMVDIDSWNKVAKANKKQVNAASTEVNYSTQPSTSHCVDLKHPQSAIGKMSSYTKQGPSLSIQTGSSNEKPTSSQKPLSTAFASIADTVLSKCGIDDLEVIYVKDEKDLINILSQLVLQFDPDILVGYEIQMLSWGYLLQRAAQLNIDLCSKISRVQDAKNDSHFSAERDEYGADHMSEIHIAGRIVLNLWRILRYEVTLNTYSFENVAFHVLHQRIPLYSFRILWKWYSQKDHLHRWRVFEHYVRRVKGQLEIIEELDLIGKTSEFARIYGILFYDVFARGSQIRVESMMLRLAKPLNFVALSPSINQRARQRAPECIPLNLEPESKYYTSPVAVLDFQSLYPSIMIAYNYCFTTCLGRLDFLEKAQDGPYEFGCTSLNLTPADLKKISDQVTVSPNGVAFLKSSVRRGILPLMVEEILNTRLMVKKSMKKYKDNKILSRMLDARQLGLKLIANVTYGYTGANFSGRMPCIEVGDSIVRKARESLERAIELVRSTPKWGAQVVYGDTDSMFIHFPGRSKDEAFLLGQEIAETVTAMFPSPIKLRFEKIYLPCVLQTKKRYVGFMYETPDQKEPVYDAKGIETVRRDACSAVSKILERSIKVLFSTHDLSRVKTYVTHQLLKIQEGKSSIIDFIFAKEYRGLVGYKPGACVPALEISRRRLKKDRKSEPRVGERVPYVIVHGSPGLPLIELVREPCDLVADMSLRLNATYYITKQILPPLDRIFSLIGISVFKWYLDMPKVVRVRQVVGAAPSTSKQGTISQFFATNNCPVCDAQTKHSVCEQCGRDPQLVAITLTTKMRNFEKTYRRLTQVCDTCQGTQNSEQMCVSLDCPIMFRRVTAKQDLIRADNIQEVLSKYLSF